MGLVDQEYHLRGSNSAHFTTRYELEKVTRCRVEKGQIWPIEGEIESCGGLFKYRVVQ